MTDNKTRGRQFIEEVINGGDIEATGAYFTMTCWSTCPCPARAWGSIG